MAGAGVQAGADAVGGADRHVTRPGAQHDRAGAGLGDEDVALVGADLGGAGEAADRDVTGLECQAHARGLVDPDRAVRALEGDVAEPSDAPEPGGGRLRLEVGAGGQPDGHLDGPGRAEDLVAVRRGRDPQDTVDVLDRGPVGGLHVAALGGVGGPDLDGGVGAVGGDDLDPPGGDVQDGGDRGGGVELLHGDLRACRF